MEIPSESINLILFSLLFRSPALWLASTTTKATQAHITFISLSSDIHLNEWFLRAFGKYLQSPLSFPSITNNELIFFPSHGVIFYTTLPLFGIKSVETFFTIIENESEWTQKKFQWVLYWMMVKTQKKLSTKFEPCSNWNHLDFAWVNQSWDKNFMKHGIYNIIHHG